MSINPLSQSSAKAKGKRPFFLEDKDTERLMTIVMALVQEVSVVRERLDTVERLLDRNEVVTREAIEEFVPTTSEADERGAWTQEYLTRVLRIMQQEREALNANDMSSEDVAEELAKH